MIAIPEKFAAELTELALQDSRSIESVVDEAISSYLTQRFTELPLTPDQVLHLKQGMADADKGDLVPEHEVEAFFDRWEKEAAAR